MKSIFLLKYAEIGIKGKNRHVFEEALCKQIRNRLNKNKISNKIINERGRIYVETETEEPVSTVTDIIKNTFGVTAVCEVKVVESKEWEAIRDGVVEYMKEQYSDYHFSFKVKCRRSDKNFKMESPEVCMEAGHVLLEEFPDLTVDVHNPDTFIWIEVRDKVYIYSKVIKGIAGMPLGTNGKSMLLLSGGIDSPVAGYMIARRGVYIDAVYFHAPPYTSDRAKQKVVDLATKLSKYTGMINLHVINFTDIQMCIYEECPHDELTIIMRRYMMKIAEDIAKKNDCLALITGESIGQVASQTAMSLACTDAAATMPVYRPLIGFDKQDIIDISKDIDTYETSILPYEDCCTIFVAKHPVTKPVLSAIEKSEENLVGKIEKLYEEALASDEVIRIHG
ncbi:MAG: tRNA 4-thiouridine(8) synthase ThiI [Lachnospiraceae bacterium]|nr:tRNA 4-thiouridine(8) synthase ThiI [Lachnospiraceae bacterium]